MSGWPLQPPTALEYFAALVADDVGPALLEAAVLVAQDDCPGLDSQAVLCEIDALGERLARRIPADAAPMQRLRQLNRYFFDELGFQGNVNDYYDPRNSYLHEVLATRRGIPITLCCLYQFVARRLGLPVVGIGMPGHFLCRYQDAQGEWLIDAFHGGRLVTRSEARQRLAHFFSMADSDGSILLLPSYILTGADGSTWSLLAVAESAVRFVTQPYPLDGEQPGFVPQ